MMSYMNVPAWPVEAGLAASLVNMMLFLGFMCAFWFRSAAGTVINCFGIRNTVAFGIELWRVFRFTAQLNGLGAFAYDRELDAQWHVY